MLVRISIVKAATRHYRKLSKVHSLDTLDRVEIILASRWNSVVCFPALAVELGLQHQRRDNLSMEMQHLHD